MATAALSNDETLGDFRVTKDKIHELGRGSYGSVYRGARVSNNDPVAIKIMTGEKEYMDLEEQRKEADLLRTIPPHENIVQMYDYLMKEYDDKGVQMVDLWLVIELCPRGNLKNYASQNELSIKRKVDLIFQSCLAVQHLHNCKPDPVVHRDIKPENILIADISGRHVIKLCDFGCARSVLREQGRSVTMKTHVGTKPYWAPEQHSSRDGSMSYHKSVDTFSLGVSNLALLSCSQGSPMTPHMGKSQLLQYSNIKEVFSYIFLCLHRVLWNNVFAIYM